MIQWVRARRQSAIVIAVIAGVSVAVVGTGATRGVLARPAPMVALAAPRFIEETATAGIDHVYGGGFEYAGGGGVAVLDCGGDGRPDVYLAGGSNPAALYRNDGPIGGPLHFTRIPDAATDLTGVIGAYPIDIDGDGIIDLVLLRRGENVLLRGLGGCRFERASERWGFRTSASTTTAFSATWEAGARLPMLAIGNYVDPASNDPHHLCFDNELLRPAGTASSYGPPLRLTPSWCALSMLFSDWSRSGRMDLRVSNDRHYYLPGEGQEQLWRVTPGEPPHLYTADEGWVTLQVEGMGIASYDLAGDGYPAIFLTSQGDDRLQTLAVGPSQPTYRDVALKRGVTAARPFTGGDIRPSTSWHAEFADLNNDSFPDLFVSKGNVTDDPQHAQRDPSDLFIGQADGTFREAADEAGILSFDRGRGAALVDFSSSGMLDLIEVNYGAPTRIWRNVGSGDASHPRTMGNWLELDVMQPAPNVYAIGAWIEVRVGERILRRERTIGGGHAGGQLGWIHFGVGQATSADVRVVWPGGETGLWQRVSANSFAVVERGEHEPRPWTPGVGGPRSSVPLR